MNAVERRTVRLAVSILVLFLCVLLPFMSTVSAQCSSKLLYGYVYYTIGGGAAGVSVIAYNQSNPSQNKSTTTTGTGSWSIQIGDLEPCWKQNDVYIVQASNFCSSDQTSVTLNLGGTQQADDMSVGWCGRPADYPKIMDYISNLTLIRGHIYNLVAMFFDSIINSNEKNRIYDNILGSLHWSNIRINQNLEILTTDDGTNVTDLYGGVTGLRNETINTINTSADYIPGLMGPGNATTGLSYMIEHSLRENKTEVNTTMGNALDVVSSGFKMLSEIYERLPEVFGNFNPNKIW